MKATLRAICIIVLSMVLKTTIVYPCTGNTLKPKDGGIQNPGDCDGSKGYTWSVVKNRCINIVETGTAFSAFDANTGKTDSEKSAYVVLSDDKLKAEVFFSYSTDKPIVMDAKPIVEGETMPVIFENKTEMLKIRFYKDAYHILYKDEIRYIQHYSISEGLGFELNNPR